MRKDSHLDSSENNAPENFDNRTPANSFWRSKEEWAELAIPGLPPKRILLLMVLSIFTGEIAVMFLLHLWPRLPMFPEAMIDAGVLVFILSPTFYFFHYRPMIQTIHHREKTMAKLSQSEERLHLALQAVNDGLWDWDIQSGGVYYSPRCALMLGYQPDELESDFGGLLFLIHTEDRDRFERLINEHLSGRLKDIDIELRLKCRASSREWLWVLVRGKVVERLADGTPLRAVGTNTSIQERKDTEAALHQNEEGIHFLSRQLINASESEKKHLAQELHDDFGQMITAFKMGIELIRGEQLDTSPELGFHCARLLEIGKRMGGSLREICDDLRPAMLDDLGLTRTLEWQISRFSEQHKEIHVRIEQPELQMRLPAEIELVCYRVCQEALHNISKHASPSTVEVKLEVTDDDVLLTISDNGCGFDTTRNVRNNHWGIGLLGMHERAAAIRGSATIDSSPDKGTRISLQLPRHPEE